MDLLESFLCVFFLCVSVQTLRSLLKKRPVGKLPPGPTPLPIIGNLLQLSDKPYRSLAKLAEIHGPIMSLRLGQVTTIVISSAALAKEVLQKHDVALSSRTVPDCMTVHNHDQYSLAWSPATATWRRLRKICNLNLFAAQRMDANQHLRDEKARQLVAEVEECCRSGAAMEIVQAALRTTLSLLSNTVFSVDLADENSNSAREFKEELECVMQELGKPNIADFFPVLKKVDPQGARRKMAVRTGKLLGFIGSIIDQRLKQKSNDHPNDMLDALLRIHREGQLECTLIKHLLFALFGAATDATSTTVEWAMAELIRNPEMMRKAQTEIEESIGRESPVKESDISNLPYLQAVVKETLRLHTTPQLLPRKAEQDVVICGFTIPKGAQVLVNSWAIGRDPTTWENPNSFLPERFLGSKIDIKGRDFEFIPFGAGRRVCPGIPLALRMVPLMVASLIHGFHWKLEHGAKPEDLNMEEKLETGIVMAHPLRAIPFSSRSNQYF